MKIARHIFFTHVQHSIDVKAVSACTFITSETATDSRHRSFCHASTWQIRLDPLSRTPRGRQIKRLRRSLGRLCFSKMNYSRKPMFGQNFYTPPNGTNLNHRELLSLPQIVVNNSYLTINPLRTATFLLSQIFIFQLAISFYREKFEKVLNSIEISAPNFGISKVTSSLIIY